MLDRPLTRRAWLGGAALTALGLAGLKPGPSDAASVSCILTPEQTEGPYYIAGEKLRRNITDGHPGAAMLLRAFVVDATTCRPIRNAAVDIWHADAAGVYSGFGAGASSRTFMRGIQRTNAKGLASFRTVYPGWYQGRTVHIHAKVHLDRRTVLTTQLYFDDAVTDRVLRGEAYAGQGEREQRNEDDGIFDPSLVMTLERSGDGYLVLMSFDVSRA
jgi:protocatechuate 3,4-dioxygenase beta subunit